MGTITLQLDRLEYEDVLNAIRLCAESGKEMPPNRGGNHDGRMITAICRAWMDTLPADVIPLPELDG